MCEHYAIIVAGGTGSRMRSGTPKQFLLLKGLPVMMHAILAFHRSISSPQIVVVIHPSLRDAWPALCRAHDFSKSRLVVDGGDSRFQSVKNGRTVKKAMIPALADCIIAVHVDARPLISPALLDETFHQAMLTGAARLARQ